MFTRQCGKQWQKKQIRPLTDFTTGGKCTCSGPVLGRRPRGYGGRGQGVGELPHLAVRRVMAL